MVAKKVIFLGLVLAVLLSACSDGTLRAGPINKTEKILDCPEFSHAEEGRCVCNTGFKKCGGGCIAIAKCCTDSDCAGGKECIGGVCRMPRQACDFHAEWDEDRAQCFCEGGYKLCIEQNRCIPADSCCVHTDCLSNERCVPTIYSIAYCLELGEKTKCKVSPEDWTDTFFFSGDEVSVFIKDIREDTSTVLKIGETEIKQKVNESRIVGNISVEITEVRELGGYCKRDED